MDIGVRVPVYRKWCRGPEVRAIAELAEERGFASLWVQDHLVAPLGDRDDIAVRGLDDWMTPGSRRREPSTLFEYYAGDDWWLEPFVTWGYLAAITSRVTLASDIVVVPYRNPIVLAKMIGTLDVLSGGRMLVGTGTGHVPAESQALGLDFGRRGDMHDEHLRVVKAMLSNEAAEFDGEFTHFGPLRTLIRSVQRPHPPIYVGGHGRRAIRRAVELGDGWLPSMVDPDGLARGVDVLHDLCDARGRTTPPTIGLSLPSALRFATGEFQPSERRPVTSPDDAIALLGRYRDLGVQHVALSFPMPTPSIYLQQIAFFADEVLPAFC